MRVQVVVEFDSAAAADACFSQLPGKAKQDTTGRLAKRLTLGSGHKAAQVRRMQGHNGVVAQPMKSQARLKRRAPDANTPEASEVRKAACSARSDSGRGPRDDSVPAGGLGGKKSRKGKKRKQ